MKRLAVSTAIASILALPSYSAFAVTVAAEDMGDGVSEISELSGLEDLLSTLGLDVDTIDLPLTRKYADNLGLTLEEYVSKEAREYEERSMGNGNGAENMDGGGSSPVPVPAALWLFGSGLVGLTCVSRKKAV